MPNRLTGFHNQMRELRKSMKEWKDVRHVVIIYNCNDQYVCESCKKIEGDHFVNNIDEIDNIPEIPNNNCTCELGCRAGWIGPPHYRFCEMV